MLLKLLGPNFSFDKTNARQENGSVISDPTNANEFIIFLKTYIQQNLRKKGIFIVSHSGFMTNLMIELLKMEQQYNGEDFGAPDLYTDIHEQNSNIAFDNLDMIHIQYDTEKINYFLILLLEDTDINIILTVNVSKHRQMNLQNLMLYKKKLQVKINVRF